MRILYVYPHPDDESFGGGSGIAAQRRAGHEVHLLTLTRGGATRQRHRLGLSIDEMGALRFQEMQAMAKALDLSGFEVLDLPDSGLKELDPREIETVVQEQVLALTPDVLVTYAVHGISGFHDHLVSHAVVKRVFCELRATSQTVPRRLALLTLAEAPAGEGPFHLNVSNPEEIDAIVSASAADREAGRRALDCYVTYQETIAKLDLNLLVPDKIHFEIFQENHDPVLTNICAGL